MSQKSSNLEIVFALLAKVKAFEVQIAITKDKVPRPKKSVGLIFAY